MGASVKAEQSQPGERVPHTIKWESADWARIEKAADKLAESLGFEVTATEIIRSGARLRADQILGAA